MVTATKDFKTFLGGAEKKYIYFKHNYDFIESFKQVASRGGVYGGHPKLRWMQDLPMDSINARLFNTLSSTQSRCGGICTISEKKSSRLDTA